MISKWKEKNKYNLCNFSSIPIWFPFIDSNAIKMQNTNFNKRIFTQALDWGKDDQNNSIQDRIHINSRLTILKFSYTFKWSLLSQLLKLEKDWILDYYFWSTVDVGHHWKLLVFFWRSRECMWIKNLWDDKYVKFMIWSLGIKQILILKCQHILKTSHVLPYLISLY